MRGAGCEELFVSVAVSNFLAGSLDFSPTLSTFGPGVTGNPSNLTAGVSNLIAGVPFGTFIPAGTSTSRD